MKRRTFLIGSMVLQALKLPAVPAQAEEPMPYSLLDEMIEYGRRQAVLTNEREREFIHRIATSLDERMIDTVRRVSANWIFHDDGTFTYRRHCPFVEEKNTDGNEEQSRGV